MTQKKRKLDGLGRLLARYDEGKSSFGKGEKWLKLGIGRQKASFGKNADWLKLRYGEEKANIGKGKKWLKLGIGKQKANFGKDAKWIKSNYLKEKAFFINDVDWLKLRYGKEIASFSKEAQLLKSRFGAFSRLAKPKKYENPDDLLFSFEDLPPFGKEYWFLHFCSPGQKRQAVMTFGRAFSPVTVNKTAVKAGVQEEGEDSKTCACVCWLYDKKKTVVIDSLSKVFVQGRGSASRAGAVYSKTNGGNLALLEGAYPKFRAVLKVAGKQIFDVSAHKDKRKIPYEIVEMLRTPLTGGWGAVMVNYYFKFSGKLNHKPISGDAYLQKVVAVLPLAPWNWVRVYFKKGASLDFFVGKPIEDLKAGSKPAISVLAKAFFEINGKRIELKEAGLESWLDGKDRKWLLYGKDFYLLLDSYAFQPFSMRTNTKFEYDEFLVNVRDFVLIDGRRHYTLKELGAGSGIVEDASGYLF